MNDLSEREILSHLEALRKTSPSRELSESAVERAISRLHSPAVTPRSRKLIRRLVISGSIAAGLVLAAGLIWITGTAREVTAAELLQQVIQTTSAYRGWVHYVYPNEDGRLPEAINGIYPGWHMNRADGTWVVINHNQGGIGVTMWSPSRRETAEYGSQMGEIHLSDLDPYDTRAVAHIVEQMPIDFESELAFFRQVTGREPLRVTRDKSDSDLRIHIRYFDTEAEAAAVLKPISNHQCLSLETTLSIDPQTKLIQTKSTLYVSRWEDGIRSNGKPSTIRVLYGPPEIHDIYDAGAPRSSAVKDFRITGEAKSVWERIEQRRERGYGDGIALLWMSYGDTDQFSVRLYMQQGAARYHGDFYINPKPAPDGQPRIAPFDDWPATSLEEVLRRARQANPGMVFVTDGKRAWGGDMSFRLTRWLKEIDLLYWEDSWPHRISGEIWPSRRKMSLYGTGTEFSMSRDAAHPERLLLHSRSLYGEQLHWLDTSRDDMPLRTTSRQFTDDGKTVKSESDKEFLEWAQLTDGRWYPTHWRTTHREPKEGKIVEQKGWEYRLRIYPDAPIDPVWLQLPPTTTSPAQ